VAIEAAKYSPLLELAFKIDAVVGKQLEEVSNIRAVNLSSDHEGWQRDRDARAQRRFQGVVSTLALPSWV